LRHARLEENKRVKLITMLLISVFQCDLYLCENKTLSEKKRKNIDPSTLKIRKRHKQVMCDDFLL